MKIKICGIQNLEDAIFCDNLGIDFLGFNFYKKSKRYISPKDAKKIILELKKSKPVGVFVNEKKENVKNIIKNTDIKIAQFHGNIENKKYLENIKKQNNKIKIIKSFGINQKQDFENIEKFYTCSDYFLFDKKTKIFGGTGKQFDWKLFENKKINKKYFLAGGVNTENILNAKKLNSFAIDIASGSETNEKKDYKKIKQIFTYFLKPK